MNIESSNINRTSSVQTQSTSKSSSNSSVKFSDELGELQKSTDNVEETKQSAEETDVKEKTKTSTDDDTSVTQEENSEDEVIAVQEEKPEENNAVGKSLEELNSIVKELNQSDESKDVGLKFDKDLDDNTKKGEVVINNDLNIQENKELLAQMGSNMNFSGDGQPFSSFMNNENKNSDSIGSSAKELAEEAEILSSMAENIALANKNTLLNQQSTEKTVTNEEGIKKVDTATNTTIETIVKYDSVVMNQADVEVFTNLVNNGEVNLNNMAPEAAEQSVQVSKTLADMIAKAKDSGQPLRIDFDNNISVIIKISGNKISADFLPSSQVAEAYLKENLPLLKQRFDENNIDYDSLNRRERREQEKDNNRKKGRENE
jgi:hypothetical protein